ncbi:hypothetical protein X777_07688 [Ooceraea biroi]|uniref:Uncharacterized protein n=1 Tax=Ooceraea biroi TaxID=2015173 RepID=A0A026W9S2_OOCBI|nr:hypothetical protein X777_07688 [Ooceraea biroi]
MRSLRLRHRADGAQGVVQLGGGGNSVPGPPPPPPAAATTSGVSTTSAATTATAATAVSTAVRTAAGRTAATAGTPEFAQELVLVLDAPFTRPQLQHRTSRNLKSKFAGLEGGGHPSTSAKIDLDVRVARSDSGPCRLSHGSTESYAEIR